MSDISNINGANATTGSTTAEPTNNQQGSNQSDQSQQNTGTQQAQERVFTQAEVNAMMAKEKDQGRKAILKELGIEDVKNAKESLSKYKEYLESQKTDLQKAQDSARQAEKEKIDLQNQLDETNQKLIALSNGCSAESLNDVCVLARARMSDSITFEQAIEQVKQGYPEMFGFNVQNKGTGSRANPQNKGTAQNVEGFGQRLANRHKSDTKNPYFNS